MLTIVVIFVYFTNGVVTLILTHSEAVRLKLHSLRRVIEGGLQLGLPQPTLRKMVRYVAELRNSEDDFERDMHQILSPELTRQFKLAFRKHFINLLEMVSLVTRGGGDAEAFRLEVAGAIAHREYQAGERIYEAKERREGRLVLIERGSCRVENVSVGFRKYEGEWMMIGRREFYLGAVPAYTVTANEYVSGLEITRSRFIACLARFPPFYQAYRQIIEAITIGRQDTQLLHIRCAFCSNYHLQEHCPLVNGWRNELRIRNVGPGQEG